MSRDDLALVGLPHASSKADELRGLGSTMLASTSLGFRGEFLSALAQIALVHISSCVSGASAGYQKELGPSGPGEVRTCPSAHAPGTVLAVTDLFCTLPVRRLVQSSRDVSRLLRSIERLAIARPAVQFHVSDLSSSAILFATQRCASELDAFAQIHGRELADKLWGVSVSDDSVSARLWISAMHISCAWRTKALQFLSVNGRPVCNRQLEAAMNAAFRAGFRSSEVSDHSQSERCRRFGMFILAMTIPPQDCDLLLDPGKETVQFRSPQRVLSAARRCLEDAVRLAHPELDEAELIAILAPLRTRDAPDTERARPPAKRTRARDESSSDAGSDDADPDVDRGEVEDNAAEKLMADPALGPEAQRAAVEFLNAGALDNVPQASLQRSWSLAIDPDDARQPETQVSQRDRRSVRRATSFLDESRHAWSLAVPLDDRAPTTQLPEPAPPPLLRPLPRGVQPDKALLPILSRDRFLPTRAARNPMHVEGDSGELVVARESEAIPRDLLAELHVLAQVENKFIVAVARGRILAVDQHAADERCQLERLQAAPFVEQTTLSPPLLFPASLHERQLLQRFAKQLAKWHFGFSPHGESDAMPWDAAAGGVWVHRAPRVLGAPLNVQELVEFLVALEAAQGAEGTEPPAVHRILCAKACRSAVKFGQPLALAEAQALVTSLARCRLPFNCAHGRPTVIPLLVLPAGVAGASGRAAAQLARGPALSSPSEIWRHALAAACSAPTSAYAGATVALGGALGRLRTACDEGSSQSADRE
jgi:DNA mismatch repair ATPase MutL